MATPYMPIPVCPTKPRTAENFQVDHAIRLLTLVEGPKSDATRAAEKFLAWYFDSLTPKPRPLFQIISGAIGNPPVRDAWLSPIGHTKPAKKSRVVKKSNRRK